MKTLLQYLLMLALCASCTVAPDPIIYGEDDCVHCAMTIMDQRYGTEIVTKKGKIYKFDSIECLIDFIQESKVDNNDVKLILLTPFNHPEELVDAYTSYILHCKELPSPMGKYLSAFQDKPDANSFKEAHGGVLFGWDELLRNFKYLR